MRFDSLKPEYLPQIVEIEKEAFDSPWTKAMFLPELDDENAYYLVALADDGVVAYGGFHKVLDEGQVANIAVRSDVRGKGIGRQLTSNLIDLAKKNGVKRMTLEVKDCNERAINLYRSLGFEVEGTRKKYYANRYDALLMGLTIGED